MALTTETKTDLYRFFSIAFNAAPGVTYMNQLAEASNAGASIEQIVEVFTAKPQFTAVYPLFLTNAEFAAKLVANVVGAAATDAAKTEAVNDITAALGAGWSKGKVIYTIFNNLANKSATDATWGATSTQLAKRVEVAKYYTETLLKDSTDLPTLQAVIANVTSTTDTTPGALDPILNPPKPQTFTLTTNVDTVTGGAGDDTINAVLGGDNPTFTALDGIDGAAGKDSLNISALGNWTSPGGATVSNVETVSIASAAAPVGAFTANGTGAVDFSSLFSGATKLVIAGASQADIKAPSSAAVTVTGVTGGVEVVSGASQSVSYTSVGGNLKLSGSSGAIGVTATKQGDKTITVDGGAAVSVATGAADTVAQGGVTIGGAKAATGAVSVTNSVTNAAGADAAGGDITVSGGSAVTVSQTAAQAVATTAATNNTITQGDVTVNGGTSTTSVTVSQSAAAAAVTTVVAVAGATEVTTATFKALAATETVTINGLTFTAGAAGTTAAETAAAFAGLESGARQGFSPKGTYSGTFSAAGWTSGAASEATVVFTGSAAGARTDLADAGTAAAGATSFKVNTQGVTAVDADGVGGVAQGVVAIDDADVGAEIDTIATVSINGYANGSTVKSDALTSLTLSNNTPGADLSVTNGTATTLALTLDKIAGADGDAAALALGGTYTALNVTTTGTSSAAQITAAGVTALTVEGTKALTLTGSTLAALKTVSVSGAAGLTIGLTTDVTTSYDSTGTTGTSTVTNVNGTKATYSGGAGVDSVTLATATALTKAISLGAGDDTLSFGALLVTGTTAAMDGGEGIDTLSMSGAAADGLDSSAVSFYTGFERLTINDATAARTLDLANLGFTNYVTTSGTADGTDVLTLNKLASGGTVVLTAAGAVTVGVANAATGTSDVLNVVLRSSGALTAGTVTAAKVETVNISNVDTNTTAHTNTLTLTAADATAVTLGGAGKTAVTLTMTGSTKVTSIDGSAMTGALTVTSLNTTSATTITGGSAADVLTAATGSTADVLIGGAGNDVLTGNAGLSTLTGGAGNDIFVIQTASTNVNSYATITDASRGDIIRFTDTAALTETFRAAKLNLGATAVFQDYANLAIATTNQGGIAWFQFGGDTYIVQEAGNNTANTFTNGTDFIVKLTGLVDLSQASFDTGAIEVRIGGGG
jgi:S-layer protein